MRPFHSPLLDSRLCVARIIFQRVFGQHVGKHLCFKTLTLDATHVVSRDSGAQQRGMHIASHDRDVRAACRGARAFEDEAADVL